MADVLGVLLVAIGAWFGACCRFLLAQWFAAQPADRGPRLPVATGIVNVTGSFLLGLLLALAELNSAVSASMVALAGTGFCGALTTFSTFSVETITLIRDGRAAVALGYVLGSLGLGVVAAAAGWWLGSAALPG